MSFDSRNEPAAAPPITINSCGSASMMTSRLPPDSMKPPKTMMKITTIPTIPIIVRPSSLTHAAMPEPSQSGVNKACHGP